jgi:chemotaxis protein MotB
MHSSSLSNMETQEMPRYKRSGSRVFVVAIVLALIAAALAFYAFQLWTAERKARSELETSRDTVAALQKEQETAGQKLTLLETERGQRAAELDATKTGLHDAEAKLAATEAALSEMQDERAEIGSRLAEFRALTAQFQRMIDSGRLDVTFRRGRMIVEMREKVLFPSASADLSDEGKTALRDVAAILRGFRDKHFIVAGHTDNIPIGGPGQAYRNNWELSTARALHVTEALIKFGVLPRQLVSAGYAEYDPIANNATQQGRQKNRRIEIVLEPRLKELPGLKSQQTKRSAKK